MKKLVFILAVLLSTSAVFAQSEKYTKAMTALVTALDTTRSATGLAELSNSFIRIGDAEKNQWLPYYYAAYTSVSAAYAITQGQMGMADKTDPIAEKAEQLINKADELSKNNSEIYCVKKMIISLRLMGDPMSRYMTDGPLAEEALTKAKQIDPKNPRVTLLEAQDKMFTPEQFGGSKEEAKKLFEETLKKFETFKPETPIHPHWGAQQASFFLTQLK